MSDNSVIILLVVGAALYAAYYIITQQRIQAATRWLNSLITEGTRIKFICGPSPDVRFESDEEPLCIFPRTTLLEQKAVRTSRGSYSGFSYRIVKGVSRRHGQFRSTSQSHEELTLVGAKRTSNEHVAETPEKHEHLKA